MVQLFAELVPLLPRKALLGCADALGNLVYEMDSRGRPVALANLRLALGAERTEEELTRIARASYRNMARTMLDLFWSERINAGNIWDFLTLEEHPGMVALRKTGKPILFNGFHYGNWEFSLVLYGYAGQQAATLINDFKNPLVGEIINRLRRKSGQETISRDGSAIKLIKRLKRGHSSGMLMDQALRPEWPSVAVDFFGLPVCVSVMVVEMAARTGIPMVHFWCRPEPDGRYTMVVGEPLTVPKGAHPLEHVQHSMRILEDIVRAQPEYFVWNYKLWRYRPKETDLPYPYYANGSGAFEKRLREREVARAESKGSA